MKKASYCKSFLFGLLSLISLFALAKQEKVIQIFRNGEIIQEYAADEIDYIEVNDLITAPGDVNASVTDNTITIKWSKVEGATYNVYRAPDNINFTLIASALTETSYTDKSPLKGSNYYRIKAIVNDVESGYTEAVAATLTDNGMESGVYLGVIGFNSSLYEYPIMLLNEASADGYYDFIDKLVTKDMTKLYYAVEKALDKMQSTTYPSDLSNVALVTFTDGLDRGSQGMTDAYLDSEDGDLDYRNDLNKRIKSQTVAGKQIEAYSIGLRGDDVDPNSPTFTDNLQKLASDPKNAYEVESMAQVNAKFKEIAQQLTTSSIIQSFTTKIPPEANGTTIRITFDNKLNAENSNVWIQAVMNRRTKALENIECHGMKFINPVTTVPGTEDEEGFYCYTFEGIQTDNNLIFTPEATMEHIFVKSTSTWQRNKEFGNNGSFVPKVDRSSAAIMLVIDCTNSLGADKFKESQKNAKDFIKILSTAVGNSEDPNQNPVTLYSKTPIDLSVAAWIDGTRYYLTPEQYKNDNLANATIEGLTVLSNLGDFIISPSKVVTNPIFAQYARTYYSEILPDKNQATAISARFAYINSALTNLGWSPFSNSSTEQYFTSEQYDIDKNLCIDLYNYTGGKLGVSSFAYIRGVKPVSSEGPILWTDPLDMTLSVIKDGERIFLKEKPANPSQYDEIEGVAVVLGDHRFIVKLTNETNQAIDAIVANQLYSDILPNKTQAEIISMKRLNLNTALSAFGGDQFSIFSGKRYLTQTLYSNDQYYVIEFSVAQGGQLSTGTSGFVRGVKAF